MAGNFHCPISLCDLERDQIWPCKTRTDILISLGTGEKVFAAASQQYRDKLQDGLVPRILNYLTNGILNNQSVFQSYICNQSKSKRDRCYRLDIEVDKFKAADDTTSLQDLRDQVQNHSKGRELRRQVVRNLLSSCFYFELESMPVFEDGVHICTGYIRIRNNPDAVLSTLFEVFPSSCIEFRISEPKNERRYTKGEYGTSNTRLAFVDRISKLGSCRKCNRFALQVSFKVRHITDEKISITLKASTDKGGLFEGNISGFPNSIDWFV